MSRPKRAKEDMRTEFDQVGENVGQLGDILDITSIKPDDERLYAWIEEVNNNLNKLNSLREDVLRFYQD